MISYSKIETVQRIEYNKDEIVIFKRKD